MESTSNRNVSNPHEFDPPSPHCVLIISTMFCMLGGALILLSGALNWVVDVGVSGAAIEAGKAWFLTDLASLNPTYSLYVGALTGGAMVIILSVICIFTEKTHKRETWPAATVITAFVTTVVVAIITFWINGDMAMLSENAALGAAPFMAVFGCVLTLAGGSVLMLNTIQEVQEHGVRMPPMPVTSRVMVEEVDDIAIPKPTQSFNCPGCRTPVDESWEVCPVCGAKLKAGPSL